MLVINEDRDTIAAIDALSEWTTPDVAVFVDGLTVFGWRHRKQDQARVLVLLDQTIVHAIGKRRDILPCAIKRWVRNNHELLGDYLRCTARSDCDSDFENCVRCRSKWG